MARSRSKKSCNSKSRKMCKRASNKCTWNRNHSKTRKHQPYCSKKRTGRSASLKGGKVAARRSRSRSRTASKKGRKSRSRSRSASKKGRKARKSRSRSRSRKGRKSRRRSRSRKARKVTKRYASNVAARRRANALKMM